MNNLTYFCPAVGDEEKVLLTLTPGRGQAERSCQPQVPGNL